jgi:hypothetical protein
MLVLVNFKCYYVLNIKKIKNNPDHFALIVY